MTTYTVLTSPSSFNIPFCESIWEATNYASLLFDQSAKFVEPIEEHLPVVREKRQNSWNQS